MEAGGEALISKLSFSGSDLGHFFTESIGYLFILIFFITPSLSILKCDYENTMKRLAFTTLALAVAILLISRIHMNLAQNEVHLWVVATAGSLAGLFICIVVVRPSMYVNWEK